MALDGIFLSKIKEEIAEITGARIDKIQQPGKEEIVLVFRFRGSSHKLYICPSANAPRIYFVSEAPESPANPPMFCMLLRKYLMGAVLTGVSQLATDRVLFLDFLSTNEIGDKVSLRLCVEIMGKSSNIVLVDECGTVIDAVKRVDFSTSSVRQILPKLKYELPPPQNKLSLANADEETITERILEKKNSYLSKAAIDAIEGISPVVAREISYLVTGYDEYVSQLSDSQICLLKDVVHSVKCAALNKAPLYLIYDENSRPKDISFFPVSQYGGKYSTAGFDSPSKLLESFYSERDRINRVSHKGKELNKKINSLIEKAARKIANRKAELEECKSKDTWKLFGELITNNIYSLHKGETVYRVANYYDGMNPVSIPADSALTPLENANRYYRSYRKAKTAELMLAKLISEGEAELAYLESVLDELSRAESDAEIDNIRLELIEGGYVKNKFGKNHRPPRELKPFEFESDDGYLILVGRNNVQNDKLSMKLAHGNDMWLHTQSFPGSHVIIRCRDGEVSDLSIEQAAVIAAYYSKARDSSLVAVDYTPAKLLKKPNGAKPGKVIYHEYYTIIVDPDENLVNRLKKS